MASNKAGPSGKRIKLGDSDCNDVRCINSSFPKIENFEYFPLKVLLQIFTKVSDIYLLNLSENSNRFENIAKMAIKERYAHNYFILQDYTINERGSEVILEKYTNFFQRFGCVVESIETENTNITRENHWLTSLLNRATNLKKLRLTLNGKNFNENLLQQHASITHLELSVLNQMRSSFREFVLPVFLNLKELKIKAYPSISFASLTEVVCNNSTLESLYFGGERMDWQPSKILELYPFDKIMELVSANLKQLKEFAYVLNVYISNPMKRVQVVDAMRRQQDQIIDEFVGSLNHLEFLAVSTGVKFSTDFGVLLHRLALRCMNIKRLRLDGIFGRDNELFKIVLKFHNVENLELKFIDFGIGTEFVSFIQNMPALHHLKIVMLDRNRNQNWSFVLNLLRKCPSLEEVTIHPRYYDWDFQYFQTIDFYNEFLKTIKNPNARITVLCHTSSVIGLITKDGVIWRNKVLHKLS